MVLHSLLFILLSLPFILLRLLGPCLIVFRNKSRRGGPFWECPWGSFEHTDIMQTACDELWEETCGLVDCERRILEEAACGGLARPWGGLFALRADGLSRDQFHSNRRAVSGRWFIFLLEVLLSST